MGLLDTQELDDSVGDFYQIQEELANAPRPMAASRSNIVEFYKGRSVFITGASGFIGKVLIEKLLRTCPEIKRIFVLIRPKWDKRPDERLTELLACPLFDGVRDEHSNLAERVIVVEGDVTQRNLGLSGQNLLRLTKEVSVIFHSAATVKFDEPLKQSVGINIAGTKNMIEFCRRCPQLAGLVHVSTAYANCDRDEINEHVYPLAMDPEKLIQMADWLDLETIQELKKRLLCKRPNTYTYTKALAEWLIVKSARDLPVVICRPSIVVATQAEPFKGWIDNANGPTGVILGAGKGLVRSMYAETEFVADLVPVDKVINLVVTLGWFAHINKNQKHLNEAAESFTESLLSGGPSSAAGSSSASTNGDPLPLDGLEQVAASKKLSEAAKLLSESNAAGGTRQASVKQLPAGHHQSKRRLATGSASSLSSANSSPSLSGEDEDDEIEHDQEEDDDDDRMYASQHHQSHHEHDHLRHNHHQHHHHHHLTQADDGYGSRSDYANSISSSSDSSRLNQKQRRNHRRHNQGSKPLIRISSICEKDATDSISSIEDSKQLLMENNNNNNNNQSANVNSELEHKLEQFRQMTRDKLIEAELPEELADVPVFHCTSGGENPISWGRVQLLVIAALSVFPSISTYRYPCGSFTNNKLLDDFYRLTLHYIPGYIADWLTWLTGGKPVLVKIFRKFDQAANVLKAFTTRQWDFKYDNKLFLMNELMNEEDRRLFNCEIDKLDWDQFIYDYVIGVKKFLLKEPMTNLEQARRNLNFVYYRNLGLQLLCLSAGTYYMASTFGYIGSTTVV